mmetsp:Transcript_22286/g.53987  ORF Transcript_22286/g.53987 Transcript_22286/m.53987 type:complete len:295 (+) Transcript_22286:47-931(+)
MASITIGPFHAQAPTNAIQGASAKMWSGKKRRPVDPEETGSAATVPSYDSELVHHSGLRPPHAKRPRTIDDVLASLSMHPPDPPGNFAHKRKINDAEEEADAAGRSAKAARSGESDSAIFDESTSRHGEGASSERWRRQLEPLGRKSHSPTNVTSELFDPFTRPQHQQQQQQQESVRTGAHPYNNLHMNEMSIDDSDRESDSSVSEGSIRNAMYQLVFGRLNNPPSSLNDGGACTAGRCYDSVDSKIEDMIRRSRLEAAIRSHKKEGEESAMSDMDMDDLNEGDEDDEWNPGHG